MLDGMSSVYALPCFANTVNGPMKRGASLLAPKSETACLARFCVANRTNEPTLNSFVFPLPLLSAFNFCRSTEAAIASCTNRITAWRRWTKSIAFELNSLFNPLSLFTTGPACVWLLLFRVSTPGVGTELSSIGLRADRARVDTADMLLVSACSFGFETGYPPPLKEGATAPSTLGTRGCLMAFT